MLLLAVVCIGTGGLKGRRGAIDIAKDINAAERDKPDARRWKDIWSAGHAVSGVADIPSVADLVDRTAAEYMAAKASV